MIGRGGLWLIKKRRDLQLRIKEKEKKILKLEGSLKGESGTSVISGREPSYLLYCFLWGSWGKSKEAEEVKKCR